MSTIHGRLSGSGIISGRLSSSGSALSGVLSVSHDTPVYSGDYTVTPRAHNETILATAGYRMQHDVTVLEIPYYETSNVSGNTVYIANEV